MTGKKVEKKNEWTKQEMWRKALDKPHNPNIGSPLFRQEYGNAMLDFLFWGGRTLRHRRAGETYIPYQPPKPKAEEKPNKTHEANTSSKRKQKDVPKTPTEKWAADQAERVANSKIIENINSNIDKQSEKSEPKPEPKPDADNKSQKSQPKSQHSKKSTPKEEAPPAPLAKPEPPVEKPDPNVWTTVQDAALLYMKDSQNIGFAKIATELGKPKKVVSNRYNEVKKTVGGGDTGGGAEQKKSQKQDGSGGKQKEKAGKNSKPAEKDKKKTQNYQQKQENPKPKPKRDPPVSSHGGSSVELFPEFARVLEEDENFSFEELQILAQCLHNFQRHIWLSIASRFWDKRGWRPNPRILQFQMTGEASSVLSDAGNNDDERYPNNEEWDLIEHLLDQHMKNLFYSITLAFNVDTGRNVHHAVVRAKLTGEDIDYDSDSTDTVVKMYRNRHRIPPTRP